MATKSPILLAIDALRAFVRALKKRPDVQVEVARLGKKAPKALLKSAEERFGEALGGELLAFYAAMNGAEIRWSFLEGPGRGALEIPALSDGRQFGAEDEHHMGFGAAKEALLLDGFGDSNAWIVRSAGSADVGEIVFAMAAEGADGIQLASSLAGYLNAAIEAGCVVNWPACKGVEGGLFAESENSLRKFKAAPVKPLAIRPGVRVQFKSFYNHGRGEVIEILQIADGVLEPWYADVGVRFAKVILDVGFEAWMPVNYMKALKKPDSYERLRGNIDGDDIEVLLEDIACAVGPTGSSYGSIGRMNATRGAGLLAPYELGEAFERVFDLYDATLALKLDLERSISIEARKKELFLAKDFGARWSYRPADPLTGLINGFRLLLTEAAWNAKTKRSALLAPSAATRLQAYENPGCATLFQEIRTLRDTLEDEGHAIEWATDNRTLAAKIGLGDERMFVG